MHTSTACDRQMYGYRRAHDFFTRAILAAFMDMCVSFLQGTVVCSNNHLAVIMRMEGCNMSLPALLLPVTVFPCLGQLEAHAGKVQARCRWQV
jgi:hypothetical protein